MDVITATLILPALGFFILYWMIRAAVKGGILDAERTLAKDRAVGSPDRADPPRWRQGQSWEP